MIPSQLEDEQKFWIRRLEATGRAQSRYLWLVFIAGLFYAALRLSSSSAPVIRVPIVDLELDAYTVLASGGPVLAFLVLAVLGAIRAWTHALEQIRGTSPATDAEPLDSFPNAIDLATYTTPQSPTLVRNLLSLAYPLYLSAALAESVWLASVVTIGPTPIRGRLVYIGTMLLLGIPATSLLMVMWIRRLRRLSSGSSAG
jgi:ABC-type amino acid transport system permease subunit